MVFDELKSAKPSGMTPEERRAAQIRYAAEKAQGKPADRNANGSLNRAPLERASSHAHPAATASVVEKHDAYYGSLGEVNDEGCIEHADERPILVTSQISAHDEESRADLARMMVLGEVLGKPRCKR